MTVAIFLMMFVNACSKSNKGTADVPIPRLDPRDEKPCYEPGVSTDALDSLVENRIALAECRRKHGNVVQQYNDVVEGFGKEEGPQ